MQTTFVAKLRNSYFSQNNVYLLRQFSIAGKKVCLHPYQQHQFEYCWQTMNMVTYFFIPFRLFMLVTLSIRGQSVHPVLTQPDPGLKCQMSCYALSLLDVMYNLLDSLQ